MGRFFVWTSRSDGDEESISSSSEMSPISTEKRIQQGRYFQWETTNTTTVDDEEKGFGYHASVIVPQIRVKEQVRVDVSQRSGSTLVSAPEDAFSPVSTMNPSVSPISATRPSQNSRTSWYDGRY